MKKKLGYWQKAFLISLTVGLIILGIRYGLYFGFDIKLEEMFVGVQQEAFPDQCSSTETGTTSNSFKCPNDASSCSATITLDCTKSTIEPKVIFRTNALVYNGRIYSSTTDLRNTYSSKWLAVDTSNSGVLTGFVYSGYGSSTPSRCSYAGTIPITKLDGTKLVTKDGLNVALYSKSGSTYLYLCQDSKYVFFVPDLSSISIEKSATETEPYKSNNQEIVDGTANSYQCSSSTSGSVSKLISYTGSVPGTKTDTITLSKDQTLNWNGEIKYSITKIKQSECTKNVAVSGTNDKYYECISDSYGCGILSTVQKSCSPNLFDGATGTCQLPTTCKASNGQILNKGQSICVDDYTLEKCSTTTPPSISIQEVTQEGYICEGGVIKPAYNVDIKINGLTTTSIVSEIGKKIIIDVLISGTSDNKRIPVTASIEGTSVSQTRLTGDTTLTAGKVTLELDSPTEGYHTIKIFIDHPKSDYTKEYDLRVTTGLTLNLYTDNPIQYDNDYIEVRLDAYKSNENKRLIDYDYEAYFNSKKVNAYVVEPSGKNLIFLFDLTGDGTLRIRAKGTDETGITTDWTEFTEITTKETTITITPTFKSGVCPGTLENTFTTTNSVGDLIDTQNIVEIVSPLQGVSTKLSPIRVSEGTYKFTHNFAEGGQYTIKVTSTSEYGLYELGDGLGVPVSILAGCGDNPDNPDDPDTNWLMYIIFAVIIGVIVLMIVLMRKKK